MSRIRQRLRIKLDRDILWEEGNLRHNFMIAHIRPEQSYISLQILFLLSLEFCFNGKLSSSIWLRMRAPVERSHWDNVGERLEAFRKNAVWRDYADEINRRVWSSRIGLMRARRVLKTDAFDEAVGKGVQLAGAGQAASYTIMDLAPGVLRAVRDRHTVDGLVCADVRELPFPKETFHAVISLSTLDHFESLDEIRTSLRELYRVLAPAGELFLTMDNLANPLVWLRNRLFYPLHRAGLVPYFVGATSTPKGIRRLLEDAGFRVHELRAIMHIPRVFAVPFCAWLSRRRPTRLHRFALRLMLAFERLSRSPLRWMTAYFVAARAVKSARYASEASG